MPFTAIGEQYCEFWRNMLRALLDQPEQSINALMERYTSWLCDEGSWLTHKRPSYYLAEVLLTPEHCDPLFGQQREFCASRISAAITDGGRVNELDEAFDYKMAADRLGALLGKWRASMRL